MPVYDYQCKCGFHTSVARLIDEVEQKPICAKCNLVMSRVFFAPPIQFKGSGWGKDA